MHDTRNEPLTRSHESTRVAFEIQQRSSSGATAHISGFESADEAFRYMNDHVEELAARTYAFTDVVRVTTTTVRTTTYEVVVGDECTYTFAHTRLFCGHATCRPA